VDDLSFLLVLAGKLAAEVVVDRAAGIEGAPEKAIQESVVERASKAVAKNPVGVKGEGPIAFGGGYVLSNSAKELLKQSDPELLIKMG
jgi:15-cis-phytoene desaturase